MKYIAENLPYFVSTKSTEVNIRKGPGFDFTIICKLVKKNIPVMVFAVFGNWYKVKLADGTVGWVNLNMVSKKRTVFIEQKSIIYEYPNLNSKVIAYIYPGVIANLKQIKRGWCLVEIDYMGYKYQGWIVSDKLFGLLNKDFYEPSIISITFWEKLKNKINSLFIVTDDISVN